MTEKPIFPKLAGVSRAPKSRVRYNPLPRPPLRVLAVGDVDHPEFAEPLATLGSEALLTFGQEGDITSPPRFDLVIVCQSRPGRFDPHQFGDVAKRYPLAGRVVLLGSWCEGETRTGRPLEGFQRLFWYQFDLWWKLTRDAWRRGKPTDWQQLPGDAAPGGSTPQTQLGLIAIAAGDFTSAETLIEACRSLGYAACWCPIARPSWPVTSLPNGGIWVGEMLEPWEEPHLKAFREWLPPYVPLLALLDFPRSERVRRARELGATDILGKPWRLDQLAAALTG